MLPVSSISPYTSFFAFIVGLPTLVGTYYQTWKVRQENKEVRDGFVHSENCLEFVLDDGSTVNLVPLETLHSLPKPGDVLLLPGSADKRAEGSAARPGHAAYRVSRLEYIYASVYNKRARPGQARLAKAVAHVDRL